MSHKKDLQRIVKLKCCFPFSGAGNNILVGAKKIARCPACGAHSDDYCYKPEWGRSKHCSDCGYNGVGQQLFEYARGAAKRGVSVDKNTVKVALEYYDRVFSGCG